MKKRQILLIVVAIVFIFIGGFLIWQKGQNRSEVLAPSPTPTEGLSVANIQVQSPQAQVTVDLPIVITGKARVFENQLQYRLIECDGNILRHGIMTAKSPDIGLFGPFEEVIDIIPEPEGIYGCIEVFSASPKDGSDINVVKVQIQYDVSKARRVNVYFSTEKTGEDCQTVSSVIRLTSSSPAIARLTLEELLRGPISVEKQQGYGTAINSGVTIQKLTIKEGVAYVDFDEQLEKAVGGSCRVSVIRNQITKTLTQFPSIKKVVISISGRTEDILQP